MDLPSTAPAAAGHKTYVFVDEYNRHKRLKVMRACDGCRKRKIRCDGALQNGPWPCGACTRLKLKCVPPTLDQEDEQDIPDNATQSNQFTFQTSTPATAGNFASSSRQAPMSHEWNRGSSQSAPVTVSTIGPTSAPIHQNPDYSSQIFAQQLGPRLDPGYPDDEYFASATGSGQFRTNYHGMPRTFQSHSEASTSPSGDPQEVDAAVRELSGQMGDLSIDLTSVAPYIANEKKNLTNIPAVEEDDVVLPPSVFGHDSTVRIPPEMRLSEDRALVYFEYFFYYIHPYVPVLNRSFFYEQWRTNRKAISPLILEGIFACVSRYLESQTVAKQWLALATRHEESFKDVPRLTTIQAMIILTKAREFIPRRGYYYRSWMAVKYMTTMAFDLGLHEHYDNHRGTNRSCSLSQDECTIRTRIWQTLFLMEIVVGAPQGRTDFAVELETVDLRIEPQPSNMDDFEYQTSRRAAFFAQAVRNIKQTNTLWQAMRRQRKDWALDPMFVRQNDAIAAWLTKLPVDMQIRYDDDDSPPSLNGNHHVAYLHVYHHLVVIMHHRPQLQTLLAKGDPSFQSHLDTCNDSATKMCRLQEALSREFGFRGLAFMQRGVGFTIYCVLTCTMLHLATITSPDPVTNNRARTYFTRHMRILEDCISSASVEIQMQINNLREAFSQDTSRPFELKPSLGLRSPTIEHNPTPPPGQTENQSASMRSTPGWSQPHDSSKIMTPATEYSQPYEHLSTQPQMQFHTTKFAVPTQASYPATTMQQVTSVAQQGYALEPVISNEQAPPVWDPSGIFNQWNTAFGAQSQAPPPPPQVPDLRMHQASTPVLPQQHPMTGQQPLYSQQVPSNAGTIASESVPTMPTVTPIMWQDAFTNAYVSGQGQKRYREETMDQMPYIQKRRG